MAGITEVASAGWYPDPSGRHQLRWFDGHRWANDVSDHGDPSIDELPPQPSAAQSNGLGIVSFVLGLVWIGGLGSLLAVIFGGRARAQARSRGASDGFAVAGITLGVVGLLAAVIFWFFVVAVGVGLHNAVTPRTVSLQAGQVATVTSGFDGGIAKVTVFSVRHAVPAQDQFLTAGKDLVAADVQVCAGSSGSQYGPGVSPFALVFGDRSTVGPSFVSDEKPSLRGVGGLGAGQCVRGDVTFEIAHGTSPIAVRYESGFNRTYEWQLRP